MLDENAKLEREVRTPAGVVTVVGTKKALDSHIRFIEVMREAQAPGTKTMNQLAVEIEAWADRKGWNKDLVLSAQVANLHTEISEAWEEIRNNHAINEVYYNPEKPEKPEGFGVELADLIVRTLHICGHYGIDIDSLVELKMAYNEKRPYRHGGKSA